MNEKISIPKPCSEDWNKMNPTNRGAYCGKCQFDVIDFTQKNPEEIREILKENRGKKTCGHISTVQLELVNTNYHLWNNQTGSTFRSKFLYACLVVFGMALFTGCGTTVVGDIGLPEAEVEGNHDIGLMMPDSILDVEYDDYLIDGLMEEEFDSNLHSEENLPEEE